MGRFLSDVFLWLATVCFILGLLILISDGIGAALAPDPNRAWADEDSPVDDTPETP